MKKVVQTAGRNALGTFAPDFAHYNDDVLFGENWNNQDIDLKTRSIITVVALMASGTTILGMLPLLFDAMFGGMAATIMGGLLVASALTLFVLPVAYCAIHKIKK